MNDWKRDQYFHLRDGSGGCFELFERWKRSVVVCVREREEEEETCECTLSSSYFPAATSQLLIFNQDPQKITRLLIHLMILLP